MKRISTMKAMLAVMAIGTLTACGGGGDGGGGGGGGVASMSETIPTTVVLGSPTAVRSGAGGMVLSSAKEGAFKAASTSDCNTKREELEELASGTGSCTFTAEPFSAGISFANGFGPQVTYVSHPERVPADFGYGGGDLGIWNSTSAGGEATAAAQLNIAVSFAASYVDNAVNIMGAIACAGEKAGVTPPAVGAAPLDLSSAISSFVTISGFTFSSATIERLADDGANPVYRLIITGSVDIEGTAHDFQIVVTHEPTAADNSTFKGKIAYKMVTETTAKPGNCDDPANGIDAVTSPGGVMAGTIAYEQASATDLRYEINSAEFCGATTNPFDSNYDIDPDDVVSASNPDGWANNYTYGRFNINPAENCAGRSTYAWMAGYGNESARTLNVSITQNADGSASGDGYFGYGPSIQAADAATIGSITGITCNWGGGVSQTLVQHQGLTRATGGTVFTPSDENITFAPTNSCSYGGGAYHYSTDNTLAANVMSNDNFAGVAVTNNLMPLATYQTNFTLPTAPADVY